MFEAMKAEYPIMASYIHELGLPVANSHGDMNNNNILYNEDTGELVDDYHFQFINI